MCGPLPTLTEDNPLESCTTTSCCPVGGLWSTWTQTTRCTDSCGSCAQVTKIRTCLSEAQGCPCTGVRTKLELCGTSVCKFPRNSCCGTLRAMSVKGKIVCGPLPAEEVVVTVPTTCCVPDGVWSNWEAWTSCQGTCNQCGTTTRARTCLSETSGCPCIGLSTESMQCQVVGVWNEWVVQSQCSDICGGCGVMTFTRTCQTSGCACIGATTKMEVCAFSTCLYPRRSCCGTLKAGSYNGRMECGPQPPLLVQDVNIIIPCITNPPPTTPCVARCSETCGLCGVMVDEPIQATPCIPLTTTIRCGDTPCPLPQNSCCAQYARRGLVNGILKCIPI
uniref:Thrombospondin type 1 domain protein n=1 Tax=Panagrolaimus sp. PS1159 TaxID=55785 RepID=A0AC35GEN6_9BILA